MSPSMLVGFAVGLFICLGGFRHFHVRASSARRNALFLDRIGHGSDSDQLALLDNKPQRYARQVWLQKLLRDVPLVNETADFIESSGMDLTVAHLFVRMAAAGSAGLLLGLLTHRDALIVVLLFVACASAPYMWVKRVRNKRAVMFESQLPQALELIALYLRSGRSLPQAFMGATEEMRAPASEEFLAAAEEYRLGRPLDAALKKLAQRYQESIGFRLFAIAVSVLGQTGGNLVEVLERIKRTLDANVTYGLRLRAMTGEARTSALILGVMPGVFMLGAASSNPGYFSAFTETGAGQMLLGIFVTLWLTGTFWVRTLMRSTLA